MGLRLFPALISASSSELSPVGDIMLKDFVPAEQKGRVQTSEARQKDGTETDRYAEEEKRGWVAFQCSIFHADQGGSE